MAAVVENRYMLLLYHMVEFGADINARDSLGQTPLHVAVACRNLLGIMFLQELGADGSTMNNSNETPIQLAMQLKDSAVVEALLKTQARPNSCTLHAYAIAFSKFMQKFKPIPPAIDVPQELQIVFSQFSADSSEAPELSVRVSQEYSKIGALQKWLSQRVDPKNVPRFVDPLFAYSSALQGYTRPGTPN